MPAKATTIYPVPGHYVTGVPAVEAEVPTKAEAEELVASGAFTFDRPRNAAPDTEPVGAQESVAEDYGINTEAGPPAPQED